MRLTEGIRLLTTAATRLTKESMSAPLSPPPAPAAAPAQPAALRVCTRCVMDTSDPDIHFDSVGVCHHCHDYDRLVRERLLTGAARDAARERIVAQIRADGVGKPYDCIIGVSGGVDSSYVAYLVKQFGLRPLAVHLDNGWNSELAVSNISNQLKILGIDLQTHVIDWEEFKDIQLAMLRASTPDSEIPTDHAIAALMRQTAERIGVRHIVTGCNIRTETHLPPAWSRGHGDWVYIRSVHRRFGSRPIHTFPHITYLQHRRLAGKQVLTDLLDYVDYVKKDAKAKLIRDLGWRDYGGKHFESIYTRFYQGYILPKKFGFDKRRSHLSSLICSGEITRAEALMELEKQPYPVEMQREDRAYAVKKFGITEADFESIMRTPPKTFWDYPSYAKTLRHPVVKAARSMVRILGLSASRRG